MLEGFCEMKMKAQELLDQSFYKEPYNNFPVKFTFVGAFKFYEALSAEQHPQEGKEHMILVHAFCEQRNMKMDIQLPKDMEIEIK